MPALALPSDVLDFEGLQLTDNGDVSNCTHPAGHCFGSDGGSGIPQNLKVAPGRGGSKEVWTLNSQKTKVLKKEIYERCQYCLRYHFSRNVQEITQNQEA